MGVTWFVMYSSSLCFWGAKPNFLSITKNPPIGLLRWIARPTQIGRWLRTLFTCIDADCTHPFTQWPRRKAQPCGRPQSSSWPVIGASKRLFHQKRTFRESSNLRFQSKSWLSWVWKPVSGYDQTSNLKWFDKNVPIWDLSLIIIVILFCLLSILSWIKIY